MTSFQVSFGTYDFFGALLTVHAASTRVLPDLVRWPPPSPQDVYDAYIGLTPIVPHLYLFLLSMPLQLAAGLAISSLPAAHGVSVGLLCLDAAVLYAAHAPLSSDRRTGGLPDLRLALMAALLSLYALQQIVTLRRARAARAARVTAAFGPLKAGVVALVSAGLDTLSLFFRTAPLYFAWSTRAPPARPGLLLSDAALAAAALVALAAQHRVAAELAAAAAASPRRGYAESGLHARLRRPGDMADALFWAAFFGFGAARAGRVNVWPAAGLAHYAMSLIFGAVLDEVSLGRVEPAYRPRKSTVWMFLPLAASPKVVASEDAAEEKKTK